MIRLLIADDEPATIQTIKKLLTPVMKKIESILVAENGIEALRFIDSSSAPNLIITDMNMPVLNGISLLKYLINNHPEIYVIVVSGYYDFEYTHAAIQAKVLDYLLKPISRHDFLAAINKAVSLIESGHNTVNIMADESLINNDVYLYLLKSSQGLKQKLQKGNYDAINEQLISDFSYIQNKVVDMNLYPVIYKLYIDGITQFYMEHEYTIPRFPSYAKITQGNPQQLQSAISELCDSCLKNIDLQQRHSTNEENLERINRYIYEHYHENITLNEIADTFYINKTYLSTLFRKKYGETAGQLIIRLKIADAKRQLSYSTRGISEISESLGYADPSYFNKQFKKETGFSPGQYRNKFSNMK